MRRAGFTLIEIMVVVGIIAVMITGAVMSVASGRGAVHIREASRGVVQMSRYAHALALLRQRPVVITYHKTGKIEVRISGEDREKQKEDEDNVGSPGDPIYQEVDGQMTQTAAEREIEEKDEAEAGSKNGVSDKDRTSFFFTRRVFDIEELRKEDVEETYKDVTLEVEVLGEDGEALDRDQAAALSLRRPIRIKKAAETSAEDGKDASRPLEEDDEGNPDEMLSVTYEPNGNCNPYRVIVRGANESESEEGFVVNISRSGKPRVEGKDDDEDEYRNRNRRRRRR